MYPRTARSGVIGQTNRATRGSGSFLISDDHNIRIVEEEQGFYILDAPGDSWRTDRQSR